VYGHGNFRGQLFHSTKVSGIQAHVAWLGASTAGLRLAT
jgi:hypothetical protein